MNSPFVFGIDGIKKPTKESIALLKKTEACGIILFAKNIETPHQVRCLIQDLKESLGRKVLVMIDHEGGLVCRFSSGVTQFPGNLALGKTRNPGYAYRVGQAMAEELAPLGINVNLSPVLDILAGRDSPLGGQSLPNYNPALTTRSFGSDSQLAARLGCEMIRGLQEGGLSACAKHFPGKGAATLDAHDTMPTIKLSKTIFFKRDLLPFKAAIKSGVDLIMSTHIACPALESSPWDSPRRRRSQGQSLPATFSRKIINDLLRQDLGFKGVIITDDLGMGAISERAAPAEAALGAASAGHDILLVCHNLKNQLKTFDGYQKALDKGEIPLDEHKARLERIERLLIKPRGETPRSLSPLKKLAQKIAQESVEIVRQGSLKLPLKSSQKPYFIIPNLSSLKSRFAFEPEMENLRLFIQRRFEPKNIRPKILTVSLERSITLKLPQGPIIFFCFDAANNESQRQLLNDLEIQAGSRSVVILMRNPWDIKLIHKKATVIDALGFRKVQLEAALNLIF